MRISSKASRAIVECAALESRRLFCMSGHTAGLSRMPRDVDGDGSAMIRASAAADGTDSIDQLNVPALSSRPSAGRKLYLDFNGHHTIDNWSGWACCGEDAGPTPAYDIDGDNDSFSFQERDNITLIWKGVSEKFSPFNIDVTTIAPSKINGARVVIGGDGAWHGSGGGVGIVGGWGEEGFTDVNGANVAFVWDGQGAGRSNPAYIVEAVAHEAGHTLDLYHQSMNPLTAPGNEYLDGLIMGNGQRGIGRWAFTSITGGLSSRRDGQTIVSEGGQNDLVRITDTGDNGFGFRVDDAGNSALTGTQVLLPITSQNGVLQGATTGVIEQMTDVDVYRITHNGGSLDIEVLAAEFRRMLDPNLKLHRLTSPGNISLLASSTVNNGSDGVGERIQFNQLNAGTYFITIAGSGAYGDIGQYRLNVRAGTPQASNDTLGTATRLGAFGRTTAEYLALGFAGTANIADSLAVEDKFDYFKVVVPGPAGGMLTARLSGMTGGSATLAIINDLNGNGIVDDFEATGAPAPTNGATSVSQAVFAGNVRFVRIARAIEGQPVSGYQLRITADTALDRVTPTFPSTAMFDPQPLQGGRLVYESIDPTAAAILSTTPDTTDYYRVTAASAGLFSFHLIHQDFTGDLRLDVGADGNLNGTLEAGEVLGSSAQAGAISEDINNFAVAQGQQLLVRVSQQTNTSDNYTLQAIADYATGGNLTGALTGAFNLTARSAGAVLEHLGGQGDVFDTYRIAPPPGQLTARITPLQLGASHRLEIIRDANGNGVADTKGEIVASGFNTQLSVTVPNPGLFSIPYYLRVASVADGGEFPSVGNYSLTFVTAGAVTGQTAASPTLLTVDSTQRSTRGYLAFDPADSSLTDLEDYYQFTLGSRTRLDVSTGDPAIGVQVGQLVGSSVNRIGGVGDFQGVVNSLSVNLDPGTYLIRTYLPLDERQDEPSGGSFVLSFKTAAITDNVPPLVTAAEFQYEIKPVGLMFTVDQDVLGSIDPSDVIVRNVATNQTFPIGQTFYDPASHQIGYAVAAGVLPDGNYRATLLASSIRDASANPLAADFSFDFFVLAGDANRDRKVDVGDLGVLASNWQLSPRTFSQADFNYDHVVNVADLGILASNWQKNLPAPTAPASPLQAAFSTRSFSATLRRRMPMIREDVLWQ